MMQGLETFARFALIGGEAIRLELGKVPDMTPALLDNLGIDEAPAALLAPLRPCFGVNR